MTYQESGMDFLPLFNSSKLQAFYIEKSPLYNNKNVKSQAVKSVEFLASHGEKFYFIECKERNYEIVNIEALMDDLKLNPQDLYEKLHHSLDLIMARKMGIEKHLNHVFEKDLGDANVLDVDFSKMNMFFYLIVKGQSFDKETCLKIREVLNKKLLPLLKIWNVRIDVIPEEKAREWKLIN